MKLHQAILANAMLEHERDIVESDIEKLFEKECYKVLEKIKAVLENDSLEDKDCFEKIEKIVCVFEEEGSHCGSRHDFG